MVLNYSRATALLQFTQKALVHVLIHLKISSWTAVVNAVTQSFIRVAYHIV